MLPLLIVAALGHLQAAAPPKFSFFINDGLFGTNAYEEMPDGSVHSTTELSAMGKPLKSELTGRLIDGKLARFRLEQSSESAKGSISFDGLKVTLDAGGKQTTRELKGAFDAVLGNTHPQLARSLIPCFKAEPGTKRSIKLLLVDGAILLDGAVTVRMPQVMQLGSAKESIRRLTLEVAGIPIDFAFDQADRVVGLSVPTQRFIGTLAGYEGVFVDPVSKFPELSQPTFKSKTERGIQVRMRDGVSLAHDMVRPDGEGRFPVILERTPYGRTGPLSSGEFYARRGYVFISQDCRGREASGGKWDPFVNERKDGYDTIEWIAKQPWCNGRVGMIGGSYLGYVQWAAAVEQPPALKCIVPQVSPPDAFTNLPYDNGIPMLWPGLWWANLVSDRETHLERATKPLTNVDALTSLPLSKLDERVLGYKVPFWQLWLSRDTMSKWTGFDTLKDVVRVKIPTLSISGWWDGDEIGTQLIWQARREAGIKKQWLIYGPLVHGFDTSARYGDEDYGQDSLLELDSLYLRWFDTWLKGKEVSLSKVPRVRAFVTGENKWHGLDDWPDPASSKPITFNLSSSGPANGKEGLGELVETAGEGEDHYSYNPANVVIPEEMKTANPTSSTEGSLEFKTHPRQQDFLVFRTAKLEKALTLAAPISLDLYFSTSARDTDFFAILLDEDEKGVRRYVGLPGKTRASFMSSLSARKLLTPGKTYRAQIKLWDTAHRFPVGHRICLVIASQMFPAYARNLNTGDPDKDATRMVVALQTIYHDSKRPSALHAMTMKE